MDATICYDWLRVMNYVIYVSRVINEMCVGRMKKRLDHVTMTGECDCEQNCMFIVYDKVA